MSREVSMYIDDMIEAIESVITFTNGMTRDQYLLGRHLARVGQFARPSNAPNCRLGAQKARPRPPWATVLRRHCIGRLLRTSLFVLNGVTCCQRATLPRRTNQKESP